MQEDRSKLLTALLGVVIGVLLTIVVTNIAGRPGKKVRASYDNWNKLNVILREVEKN